MEKKPFLNHKEEVQETANAGIVLYGLGDFGRANLKILQENCELVEATGQKIKVVSGRLKAEVVQNLYEIAQKRLYDNKFKKEEVFWWCSNLQEITDVGNAHVSQFETKFEVVTEDKIFQIQDETRKSIEGLVHVLTCKSDKSPHYKKKINEYADHKVIILDGVKGHTEKVDLNNENVEYVSLVGPNYAVEIIERAVTAILLASECAQTANEIKNLYNVSPDIKAEVFDKPEKLERVGVYKNIATFAFGIAINYITDKKKRTDLFIKILEDFTKYAQYVGLEDSDVEKNIEEMTYAFLGDMWMCMLHGISELSGKRSRNLTVSREVGEIVKEKQKLQKVLMNAWQKKFVKILNLQEDKENNLNDLFSCKMEINSPETFVNLIAQKNGLRTIEGFQSYKRLLAERADLEIIQFITDALNGENIENHSYLNLAEREGRAEMKDEEFVQIKNETRKFKETTMELECPANTLAFVLCEYTKNVILKIENPDTKNHVFRMILDVFQEEKGLIKKIQDWVPTNIPLLGNYAKAQQDKKQNVLDSFVDEAMITKA